MDNGFEYKSYTRANSPNYTCVKIYRFKKICHFNVINIINNNIKYVKIMIISLVIRNYDVRLHIIHWTQLALTCGKIMS